MSELLGDGAADSPLRYVKPELILIASNDADNKIASDFESGFDRESPSVGVS